MESSKKYFDSAGPGALCPHYIAIHFMASVPHHSTLLWERLKGVSWNEPGSRDVVFGKELQESPNADGAGEKTYPFISWKEIGNSISVHAPLEISLVESSPP